MKRAAFTALAAATAIGCPAFVRAQTRAKVRIGSIPVESYGLAYFARDQGFFERNGIDAEVLPVAGLSGGITAALVGGALDIGCVSMGPTANAYLRGLPIRIIAPGGISTSLHPTTQLIVTKNSSVKTARDLNGKTIGTSVLRDIMHVATLKWMDDNGGDSKTVKIVEMPNLDALPSLATGRIDAYPQVEPLLAGALQSHDFRSLGGVYSAIAKDMMISLHIATLDWLDKNTDVAQRSIVALRQAAHWANTDHAGEMNNLATVTKIPIATIERMNHAVQADTLDVRMIQPQIEAFAQYGFIAHSFPVTEMIWPPAR